MKLGKNGSPTPRVNEVPLETASNFMYENFVIATQREVYLLLASDAQRVEALKFEFIQFKYGHPNDEIGHPLQMYGLGFYGLFEVNNSPWLEAVRQANAAHHRHSDEHWKGASHFICKFKDVTFEVLSRSFERVYLTREKIGKLITSQIEFLR